jgi:DoxX-like family
MKPKIVYWGATGLVTIVALLGGFSYVTNAPEAVENFRHVGYPQQLRVLLGIAKLAGAIVLLLPWLPTLKEWAYAGFTFTWIAATVAHYLAGDAALSLLPVALLGSLAVSYVTRPANRRGFAKSMLVQGDGSTPVPASGPYGGIGRGVEDLRAR